VDSEDGYLSLKVRSFALLAVVFLLAGCGVSMPTDPHGTLRNISGGTLRVGVTESVAQDVEWVRLPAGSEPTGIEPELIRGFAAGNEATIEWVQGSEHELVEELKHGELDMVVGGFAKDTPWAKHAGMTRPYVETEDERGKTVKHVVLVRMGENALLLALDKYLLSQEVDP
jgi:ABC-type amino acid transport substrate-binding protein